MSMCIQWNFHHLWTKEGSEKQLIYLIMFIMHLWQDSDGTGEVSKDIRNSLLMMNFSVDEVDLAIKRLGRGNFPAFQSLLISLLLFNWTQFFICNLIQSCMFYSSKLVAFGTLESCLFCVEKWDLHYLTFLHLGTSLLALFIVMTSRFIWIVVQSSWFVVRSMYCMHVINVADWF